MRDTGRRLMKELQEIVMGGSAGISAFPFEDRVDLWTASIEGPEGSPYAGMDLWLALHFPTDYPTRPPVVVFLTPIYHPNIDNSGRICIDILKDQWTATYTVRTILLSLQSLLNDPNNDSPLNAEAANMWDHDKATFAEKAKRRHRMLEDSDNAENPVSRWLEAAEKNGLLNIGSH